MMLEEPVQQEDPITAYKRKYGGAQQPTHQDDPIAAYKTKYAQPATPQVAHGASGSWGDEPRSGFDNVTQALVNGATFGAGNKIDAFGDALHDKLAGKPFGQSYRARLQANRDASSGFAKRNPVSNIGLELAGGLGSMIASGGAGAPSELATAGRAARMLKAGWTGAKLGGLSGAINSDASNVVDRGADALKGAGMGAAGGALMLPVGEAAGALVSKTPIPRMLSAIAGKGAGMLPAGSRMQQALQQAAEGLGPRGQAASQIGRRMQMDAKGGFTPPPAASGLPPMALNDAGPQVEGLAKGIVRQPGPASTSIRQALEDRQAQMRPSVTQAFERGTGVTGQQGEDLTAQLAQEQEAIRLAGETAKKVRGQNVDIRAANKLEPKPPLPDPNQAWEQQIGRPAPSGIGLLREAKATQSANAAENFGAARAATEGQAMQSPTLDAVMQTPIGKQALTWAKGQKLNRGRELPTVETPPPPPSGFSQDQWDHVRAKMEAQGMEVPAGSTEDVADPETLHFMKQYLAKVARMGVHDGAQGTVATQAQGALGVWGKVKSEMPAEWQHADQVFAADARVKDMTNMGRNLMNTRLNPAGDKALYTSLDAIEAAVSKAPPHEQQAFRDAARSAVADYFRSGRSRLGMVSQLSNPASEMSRRVVLATGDGNAPEAFRKSLLAPNRFQWSQLKVPDVPEMAPESKIAQQGMDILRTKIAPSSGQLEKSLPALDAQFPTMGQSDQSIFRSGAAAGVRGGWEGVGNSVQAPGRFFNASPERARQVAYAFPNSQASGDFQNTITGWDRLAKQKQNILGGSDTFANAAEGASRDPGIGSLFNAARHPLNALGSLAGGIGSEASKASRIRLDQEIAKILTSPDVQALPQAQQMAVVRQRLADVMRKAGSLGVVQRENQP